MASDSLRKIAATLREEAAVRESAKMIKCAQVLQAAGALNLLRTKVKTHVR
jgi:hypothetical protein